MGAGETGVNKIYDPKRPCPKCRAQATTCYNLGRMQRVCVRCGYEWFERPADEATAKDIAEVAAEFRSLLGWQRPTQ